MWGCVMALRGMAKPVALIVDQLIVALFVTAHPGMALILFFVCVWQMCRPIVALANLQMCPPPWYGVARPKMTQSYVAMCGPT